MDTARPATRRRGRPGHDLDAVLAAAVRLFNARGYDATSMFDVAEALGITKSTLYHHVSGKEQLLAMAVDRAVDGLFEAATQVQDQQTTATVRLQELVRRSVLVLAERLEFVTLLLRVHGNSEVEQHALARRREFDALVTELVKQAQAEGGIRADVDPATAARLLFGMVNSLVGWYRPERGHPETIAATVVRLAFDGLRTIDTTDDQGVQEEQ
ncbi:TetR family transcriptional regulator [Actinoplanes ianthinogenes]|uniref:TetR family transcriptional regulator n=1 Tax=Actinoplanes ianthinogenes TaxID=122358 RepID=A0ABM7M506_9ACTN|nr:TetR/AcrR family transcriptional regulator [Actinoplanes ianthinogenes]BCJ46739.1 TetR family transcriptional regulator [Actinoplanes ianthinogenes]GGR15949.1 TetR family transcriptional regulator [Actinoplanes ianthinogenes]